MAGRGGCAETYGYGALAPSPHAEVAKPNDPWPRRTTGWRSAISGRENRPGFLWALGMGVLLPNCVGISRPMVSICVDVAMGTLTGGGVVLRACTKYRFLRLWMSIGRNGPAFFPVKVVFVPRPHPLAAASPLRSQRTSPIRFGPSVGAAESFLHARGKAPSSLPRHKARRGQGYFVYHT